MLLVGEISDNRDICMNERMLERLSDSCVKFFHDSTVGYINKPLFHYFKA